MKRRPRDVIELGRLITDIAVGDVEDHEPQSNNAHGGEIRATKLTPEHRKEIATKAAAERWKKTGMRSHQAGCTDRVIT
jgi:glutathione synthase/RimK-type ligase-like ATP-grasp enzyme